MRATPRLNRSPGVRLLARDHVMVQGAAKMRSARLDATDWRILRELQADGRITNVELARKVGISAPPSRRPPNKRET